MGRGAIAGWSSNGSARVVTFQCFPLPQEACKATVALTNSMLNATSPPLRANDLCQRIPLIGTVLQVNPKVDALGQAVAQ